MYSFYVDGDDIKILMNHLLKEDTFKSFELIKCEIKKNVVITIDGRLNKNWYNEELDRDYANWNEIKTYAFDFIKGKRTPDYMKLVLSLNKASAEKVHKNAKTCCINITFEPGRVSVVTGTVQKEFSMDRSLDDAWENSIKKFFKNLSITQNTL